MTLPWSLKGRQGGKGLSEQQSSRQSCTANLSPHSPFHFMSFSHNVFICANAGTVPDSHAFGDGWDFSGWTHTFILLGMWSIPACLLVYIMAYNIRPNQVQNPYGLLYMCRVIYRLLFDLLSVPSGKPFQGLWDLKSSKYWSYARRIGLK